MEKLNEEKICDVVEEMRKCFSDWNKAIENKQQPITIQDLDFWITQLEGVVDTEQIREKKFVVLLEQE